MPLRSFYKNRVFFMDTWRQAEVGGSPTKATATHIYPAAPCHRKAKALRFKPVKTDPNPCMHDQTLFRFNASCRHVA